MLSLIKKLNFYSVRGALKTSFIISLGQTFVEFFDQSDNQAISIKVIFFSFVISLRHVHSNQVRELYDTTRKYVD